MRIKLPILFDLQLKTDHFGQIGNKSEQIWQVNPFWTLKLKLKLILFLEKQEEELRARAEHPNVS